MDIIIRTNSRTGKPFVYVYNTGTAHGHRQYGELGTFIEAFKDKFDKFLKDDPDVMDLDFFTITNVYQTKNREFFDQMGWNTSFDGRLWYTVGSIKSVYGDKVKDDRPRNKDGRLLNKDGTVKRDPFEYFVGDRIKFIVNGEEKTGRIREVFDETGINRRYKTRLHTIAAHQISETIERVL